MKKIILLLLASTFIVSCGKNKSEQMLYDYQQKNVKALNFDLADLDFKIIKVEKVIDITAADSIKHLKKELAEFWTNNPEQSLVDTISFKYVKRVLNETIDSYQHAREIYQESVLAAIRTDNYSRELESKRNRDKAADNWESNSMTLIEIKVLERYYDKLSKKPDSVLSTKYKANYSFKNPMLGNVKQTFEKEYYTNAAQNKFIKEEIVEVK
jgi:PBP1b-binding outer membrane lipoprotein LpoB